MDVGLCIFEVNNQMLTEWYAWDSVRAVFEKTLLVFIKINYTDMESSGFMVFIQKLLDVTPSQFGITCRPEGPDGI